MGFRQRPTDLSHGVLHACWGHRPVPRQDFRYRLAFEELHGNEQASLRCLPEREELDGVRVQEFDHRTALAMETRGQFWIIGQVWMQGFDGDSACGAVHALFVVVDDVHSAFVDGADDAKSVFYVNVYHGIGRRIGGRRGEGRSALPAESGVVRVLVMTGWAMHVAFAWDRRGRTR